MNGLLQIYSDLLVTARRQKHNGMSWSKAGSHALTALNAVVSTAAFNNGYDNEKLLSSLR